jgi:hypothetical protein
MTVLASRIIHGPRSGRPFTNLPPSIERRSSGSRTASQPPGERQRRGQASTEQNSRGPPPARRSPTARCSRRVRAGSSGQHPRQAERGDVLHGGSSARIGSAASCYRRVRAGANAIPIDGARRQWPERSIGSGYLCQGYRGQSVPLPRFHARVSGSGGGVSGSGVPFAGSIGIRACLLPATPRKSELMYQRGCGE